MVEDLKIEYGNRLNRLVKAENENSVKMRRKYVSDSNVNRVLVYAQIFAEVKEI